MLIYSRNTDPLATDDFGQVGEIRPMKRKPMALTCAILMGAYIARRLILVNLMALLPWVNPKKLVPIMVGSSLIFVTCFFKVRMAPSEHSAYGSKLVCSTLTFVPLASSRRTVSSMSIED